MNPQYPLYIISKGRWESRLTSKALERMQVPYSIVVEPQEYDRYAAVINPKKILVLPFSNLGQGSIPARNWVWDHALTTGKKRHWIMDDNIYHFGMFNHNKKIQILSGTFFKMIEDFTDRYQNVAFAGPQYDYFVARKVGYWPPFAVNTRIYSCILIKNDLQYRWRGKYNEDTDLCLRALKDGWCTILFYMFYQKKVTTMVMKGGNTDNVYIDGDGRLKFAQSLQSQHPDVVKIVHKWGRWHHYVDYRSFILNNKLKFRKDFVLPKGHNDYGLTLIKIGKDGGE